MVGTAEYHVGRNEVSQPKKLLTSHPGVQTTLAPAASEVEHRGDETMPMKERQHIQAPISFFQRQRRDASCKPTHIYWRASSGHSSAAPLYLT